MNELEELGRAIARAQDQVLAAGGAREQARARLLASAARPASRWSSRGVRLGLAAAGALVGVTVAIAARTPPVTYSASPGESSERAGGRWLTSDPGAGALPVHFSDRSAVTLRPGAAARVAELGRRHARLVLETGGLDVVTAEGSPVRWRLDAGPFELEPRAARFAVSWRPDKNTLELHVIAGAVAVGGGVLTPAVIVHAGEVLRASRTRWTLGSRTRGPPGGAGMLLP